MSDIDFENDLNDLNDPVQAHGPAEETSAAATEKQPGGPGVIVGALFTRRRRVRFAALADLCGFPSALVMRRQFRARTGTTPTAWREKSSRSAHPLSGQ